MNLAALVSLLVAIAKALPAVARIADQFEAAWREHRRTQAHARIDAAVASAQAQPWECPPRCPHRDLVRGLRDGDAPSQPGGPADRSS